MLQDTGLSSEASLPTAVVQPVDHLTGTSPKSASHWKDTLDRVIKSVVSLHYAHVRAFDVQPASYARATGFVVDKDRGYILTNRHVVGPGPFWGYCTFSNHEEVRTDSHLLSCSSNYSSVIFKWHIMTQYMTSLSSSMILQP